MKYKLHGIAPARTKVLVEDQDTGRIVAQAVADIHGDWTVDTDLAAGSHDLRAVSVGESGCRTCSQLLCVDVGADVEVEADDEVVEFDCRDQLTAEQHEEYNIAYWQFVNARAQGYEIALDQVKLLLPWVGKTLAAFGDDVIEMAEINAELGEDVDKYPIRSDGTSFGA